MLAAALVAGPGPRGRLPVAAPFLQSYVDVADQVAERIRCSLLELS